MAGIDKKFDDNLDRLDGSKGDEKGGLIIMKQKSADGNQHVFKSPSTPRGSVLGLDKLAAEKRKEQEKAGEHKSAHPFKKIEDRSFDRFA